MNLLICTKLNPEQGFNTTAKSLEIIIKNLKKKYKLYIFIFLKKKETRIIKNIIFNFEKLGILKNRIFFFSDSNCKNYFVRAFPLFDQVYYKLFIKNKHLKEIKNIIDGRKIKTIFEFHNCSEVILKVKNVERIFYGGHPEFAQQQIRYDFSEFFFPSKIKNKFLKYIAFKIKKFFFKIYILNLIKTYHSILREYDKIITFNYQTYRNLINNGFKDKSYFVSPFGKIKKELRIEKINKKKEIKLIGCLGNKFATNNTISSFYIFKYLLPKLKFILKKSFKIITFGKGNFSFNLKNLKMGKYHLDKGFVENYNDEFKKNDFLLLCQNSLSTKKVVKYQKYLWDLHSIHSRIFDAFNNGVCIAAHSENLKSMPQLKHGYNCIAGKTPISLAKSIKKIYFNTKLRRKILINGFKTLRKNLNNKTNIKKLENIINKA